MNPRSATAESAKNEMKTSPFERIADHETLEQVRLNEVVERLQLDRINAEKEIENAEKHAEEKIREEAEKRLLLCKEQVGKEMEPNEGIVKEDVKAIEVSYKKHAPALIEEQSKAFLSLTI